MEPISTRPGISLRALAPNAVTAVALCTGLSGAWFALQGRWENAVAAIVVAGVLDAMDGRIARMLKGESRFGAELEFPFRRHCIWRDARSDHLYVGHAGHAPFRMDNLCLFRALRCAPACTVQCANRHRGPAP